MPQTRTIAATRAAEFAAVARGSTFDQLMEQAGFAACQHLLKRPVSFSSIWILCGKGNNGGDGLVMARHLAAAGKHVTVSLVQDAVTSELAQLNQQRLPDAVVVRPTAIALLQEYDVVVDAVFGIGFAGDLPPDIAAVFHACQLRPSISVALDLPSGIHGDSGHIAAHSFRADLTYAFANYKPAHHLPAVQAYCGDIVVLDIGLDVPNT